MSDVKQGVSSGKVVAVRMPVQLADSIAAKAAAYGNGVGVSVSDYCRIVLAHACSEKRDHYELDSVMGR
jgi:hypothetical protein